MWNYKEVRLPDLISKSFAKEVCIDSPPEKTILQIFGIQKVLIPVIPRSTSICVLFCALDHNTKKITGKFTKFIEHEDIIYIADDVLMQ